MENNYQETSCTCNKCMEMCQHRPCWPTPQEAVKLIENGYADRLMRDYWVKDTGDTSIISPAITGYEGINAPFYPFGRCTFLTDDGLCELHDKGLKPFEGRMANCGNPNKYLHKHVAKLWDTEEGEKAEKLWYRKINFEEFT